MSIDEKIDRLVKERKLFPRHPEDRSGLQLRSVYMSREVKALVDGDSGVRAELLAVGTKTGALFDHFIHYKRVTFGMDPFAKDSQALFARNHKVSTGICDVRVLWPKPQVRIFGAFAARDTFVALTYNKRHLLDFFFAVRRCRSQWDHLFDESMPIVSENVNDYVSPPVTAV